MIYHVCKAADWVLAQTAGHYTGSADDTRDGFIHFSALAQLRESVARHRAGQNGLVLLVVDPAPLGETLKWEPSRGGALFPHLYGALPLSAVVASHDLPLGPDGAHVFPADISA
ncbi:MAG: DUF952 domain-containing protein [Alphaproteobacteria bacterium]|nr:DUF952 domain-containing protein [Alphaproteobacteria bacterium]